MDHSELWQAYQETRSDTDRNQLAEQYLPFLRGVAQGMKRTLPEAVEVEDLIQYGVAGLLDSIERFECGRGIRFETFAMLRIRGAMVDGLRGEDWVPRLERARQKKGDVEPKCMMPFDFTEIRNWQEGDQKKSKHEPVDTRAEPFAVRLRTEDIFRYAAKGLSKRERLILGLIYIDNKTMKETGKLIGVSESRVSQMHSQMMARLRERLGPHDQIENVSRGRTLTLDAAPGRPARKKRALPLTRVARHRRQKESLGSVSRRMATYIQKGGMATERQIAADLCVPFPTVKKLVVEGNFRKVGNLVGLLVR